MQTATTAPAPETGSVPTGCVPWVGARTAAGYGTVSVNGRTELAHRIAVNAPPGTHVRHTCDTPACVNPAHLLVGTRAENMADMVARGRSSRGEHRPAAKLTESDVRIIRGCRGVVPQRTLAAMLGVSTAVVTAAQLGHTWKHVT